jgi:hypothetical protein
MSRIFLDWNLGLGDAILCNGLVRELAKNHEFIVLPVKHSLELSVRQLFSDLKNVAYLPVDGDSVREVEGLTTLRIGLHAHPPPRTIYFDEGFYMLAGVPYDCRWSSFQVPSPPDPLSDRPQCLVAEEWSGGHCSIPVEGLRLDSKRTPVLTNWIPVIQAAEEIHCIDSAPMHLIESVPTKARLFFWNELRKGSNFARRKAWRYRGLIEGWMNA